MDVTIKQSPSRRLAAIRHIGPYNQIGSAFDALGKTMGPLMEQLASRGRPEMLAVFLDDPRTTPADQLRSDAALVVPEDFTIPSGLTEQRLHGGTYACALHVGPYSGLPDAWGRFANDWLPASGRHRSDAPSFELYLNHPGVASPLELQTELYLPLEDRTQRRA